MTVMMVRRPMIVLALHPMGYFLPLTKKRPTDRPPTNQRNENDHGTKNFAREVCFDN